MVTVHLGYFGIVFYNTYYDNLDLAPFFVDRLIFFFYRNRSNKKLILNFEDLSLSFLLSLGDKFFFFGRSDAKKII